MAGHRAPPRVVFFVPRFHTNMSPWVGGLQERGYDVEVWAMYQGHTEDYRHVKPRIVGYDLFWRLLSSRRGDADFDAYSSWYGIPSLRGLLRGFRAGARPDVIVIRNANTRPALLVLAIARLFSVARVLLYSQGPKMRDVVPLKHKVGCWMLLDVVGARGLMTPVLGSGANDVDSRIAYVPFSHRVMVEPADVKNRHYDPIVVLAIGKMMPRKRLDVFIRAFDVVRRLVPNHLTALVVGECSTVQHKRVERELRTQIASGGLDAVVELRTNVPYDSMDGIYRKAHLFVLPSVGEPAAYSIVEAMAYGLPTICTDDNGTACYVEEGRTGSVCRKGSEEEIAAALRRWCSDPEKLREASLQALQRCTMYHDPAGFADFMDRFREK